MGTARSLGVLLACAALVALLAGCAGMQAPSAGRPELSLGVEVGEAAPATPPTAAAAEALAPPAADPGRTERLVIYNADIGLVVSNIAESLRRINEALTAMGGYMQQMTSDSITMKVPAGRFHEAMAAVEGLGETAHKEVIGTDVTEEMRDLRIRLQNAELVRDRLAKLLEKADKVEDALKVEKELERVTVEIELLKGKTQYLQNNIAFSSLTVRLNSPLPQRRVAAIPFRWVGELAAEMSAGSPDAVYTGVNWGRRVAFDMPEGFVKYYEKRYVTRAMSADGVTIKASRYPNYKNGTLAFWHKLLRRELIEGKAIAIGEELQVKIRRGRSAQVLVGTHDFGGKPRSYLVAFAVGKDHVYVLEAWSAQESFTAERANLDRAVRSLWVPWWD